MRIYDTERGRQLVAAIEIISPSNKDRPESRDIFVGKVASLLQQSVCVSLVDLVSVRLRKVDPIGRGPNACLRVAVPPEGDARAGEQSVQIGLGHALRAVGGKVLDEVGVAPFVVRLVEATN